MTIRGCNIRNLLGSVFHGKMDSFYAVNIADLTKDSILAQFMIAPHIVRRQIVRAEKTIDGDAVVLESGAEQSQAIVDVVRRKYDRASFRFYHSTNGRTWKKI